MLDDKAVLGIILVAMGISKVLQPELRELVASVNNVIHIHPLAGLHLGHLDALRHDVQRFHGLTATVRQRVQILAQSFVG